ncbi:MAG: xanthine phosphoribosyltransferase [Candidatus Limiplasma sp.]|nr:xanthine phosphoribosyltransferase [Candidatus Limiplasma sp.]
MKELVEAIRARGVGVGTDIVKVDMFLNHRLDTDLFVKMGQAFAQVFVKEKPDLVLTVEASGIAAALTTAMACGNIPVVFAKKSRTRNVTGDVYESRVFSFTHGVENHIRVAKDYLPKGSRVLIVDDFLANGEAAEGLCDLVRQAQATVVGIGICVEKSFQPGHQKLAEEGYHVVSLARVTAIRDGKLIVED